MQRFIAAFAGVLFLTLVPSSLFAQDRVDIFVGDAFMIPPVSVSAQSVSCPVEGQCSPPPITLTNRERLNGFELAASHHFTPSLSLTADFSSDYGLATSGFPTNGRARQYTFLGGVQWSKPSKQSHLAPYVHILAGASRQSATHSGNSFLVTFPDTKWGFAAAAGAGIDLKLTPNFTFRLMQADYLVTHFDGTFQSQPRLSIGFIFSL